MMSAAYKTCLKHNSKISSLCPSLYGFCFKLWENFPFDAILSTIRMKGSEKKIQLKEYRKNIQFIIKLYIYQYQPSLNICDVS